MVKLTRYYASSLGDVLLSDALVVVSSGRPRLPPSLPESITKAATSIVELGDFKGEVDDVKLTYVPGRPPRLILSGAGGEWPREPWERLRWAVAAAAKLAADAKLRRLAYVVEEGLLEEATPRERDRDWMWEQVVVAIDMAGWRYRFNGSLELEEVRLVDASDEGVERGWRLASAVRIAREFANAPPSRMNPEGVEEFARRVAREYGLRVEVLHAEDLRRLGMEGILAVGSGSRVPPRLVILEYRGGGPRVALVGKTVTFDSGGLNLKSFEGMLDMKYDKAGGGVVLAAVVAAAALKLRVDVYALLPAVENMPGGGAYKPRDILRMYNGKSVEVISTDAEGRLTLADAIAYAAEELKADYIVDVATLTSAAVIALGNHMAPFFSNNDELAALLERASRLSGEPLWRMPLDKPYVEQMKSNVADMVNSGGRQGALVTAAAFLSQFTSSKPWAHIDIAGVAWVQEKGPKRPYYNGGATGWGVRTLVELLRELQSRRA